MKCLRTAPVACLSLLILAACAQQPAVTDVPAAATSSENVTLEPAPNYPRTISGDSGQVVIHMPQVESWENFETATAWSAVEVTLNGDERTWIGGVKFSASTDIDFDRRLVVVHDIEIIDRRFDEDQTPPQRVIDLARTSVSLKPRTVPLDVVIRALPEDFEVRRLRPGPEPELNNEPPPIYVAVTPTALMNINGEPIRAPISETELDFVVNTNWDLFWHRGEERWYVLNGDAWQVSSALSDPFVTTADLPEAFSALPGDDNFSEVVKHIPAGEPASAVPRLLVSLEPAELILLDGEAVVGPMPEAGLEWISNTESDIFLYQGAYYYLVSGRWFRADALTGPWQHVSELPENFAFIDEDHRDGRVLAAVPGSDAARAAAIEAQIPRTAAISRSAGADITVEYAGEPQFVAIEGTGLQRAANTSYQVIQVGESYYLCHNAVWFVSNNPASGWTVATNVPPEIYAIPASDPAHNTTYVYVYPEPEKSTSTTVTYAYTGGYYGTYLWAGAVIYGTGWWYEPYYYYHPWGYPAYWHYPPAYGYGAWYNPATGTYGRRAVAYGPYGGSSAVGLYNPRTGTYGRGWSAWDSDELARGGYAYNPRRNAAVAGNMYYDFDEREGWSERYVQRGDRWVYSETDYDGNRARSEFETGRGITGTSERTRNGDSITGRGTLERGDRTATTESRIDRDGAQVVARGDQGGSVELSRERGQRGTEIDGRTADGREISGRTEMTRQGRRTGLEGEAGGQAVINQGRNNSSYAGRSASGDLYAGANGQVYRRGDDGSWSRYQSGGWNQVDRSTNTRSRSQNPNRSGVNSAYQWDSQRMNRQHRARSQGTRNFNRSQVQRRNVGGGRRGRFR